MDVTVGDRPSATRLSRSVALVEAMDAAISAVGTRDTRGFLEHCGYGRRLIAICRTLYARIRVH